MDFVKTKASQIFGSANTTTKKLDDEVHLQVGQTVWPETPRHMRTELWLSVLNRRSGTGINAKHRYAEYLATDVPPLVLDEIRKDVARTFPDLDIFNQETMTKKFANVLRAYAAYDPEVGYCQGMNFLAGMLLAYVPDEADAFGLLVVLLRDRNLRELYKPDMSMLQARLWQIGRLMPQVLAVHLESHGTLPVLYASSWLMTCFASDFPIPFSSRIVDVVLSDSYAEPLMKVVLAILRKVKRRLLDLEDMEEMVEYLKQTIPNWPLENLQKLLTDALGRQWTLSEKQVLSEVEGAETVLDAVRRVRGYEGGPATERTIVDNETDNTDDRNTVFTNSVGFSGRNCGLPETRLRTKPIMSKNVAQTPSVVPKLEPPAKLRLGNNGPNTSSSLGLWKAAMLRRSLPAAEVAQLIEQSEVHCRQTHSDTHEVMLKQPNMLVRAVSLQPLPTAKDATSKMPQVKTPHLLDDPCQGMHGFDSLLDMPLPPVDSPWDRAVAADSQAVRDTAFNSTRSATEFNTPSTAHVDPNDLPGLYERPTTAPVTSAHTRIATRDFAEFKTAHSPEESVNLASNVGKHSAQLRAATGGWTSSESAPKLEQQLQSVDNLSGSDDDFDALEDILSMIPDNPAASPSCTSGSVQEAGSTAVMNSTPAMGTLSLEGELINHTSALPPAMPLDLLSDTQEPVSQPSGFPPFFDNINYATPSSASTPNLPILDKPEQDADLRVVYRRTLPSYSSRPAASDQLPLTSPSDPGTTALDAKTRAPLRPQKIEDWAAVQNKELNAFLQMSTTTWT